MKILFVCAGNLCRSPLAAAYFKKLLHEKDVSGIDISSAGIWAIDGNIPEDTAFEVAAENEIDISNHCSRLLSHEDINESDLILVMEKLQLDVILSAYPEAKEKVKLLRSFARDGAVKSDIIDSFGMTLAKYRECFNLIKESIEGLFKYLKVQNKI